MRYFRFHRLLWRYHGPNFSGPWHGNILEAQPCFGLLGHLPIYRLNITEKGDKLILALSFGVFSIRLTVLSALVGSACCSCFGGYYFSSSCLSLGPDKIEKASLHW